MLLNIFYIPTISFFLGKNKLLHITCNINPFCGHFNTLQEILYFFEFVLRRI
jgi:hypothetical protein